MKEMLFVLEAHFASGHGDTSELVLITDRFDEVVGVLDRLEELGYRERFYTSDHGVSLLWVEKGKGYPRKSCESVPGQPIPSDFPMMAFFRWRSVPSLPFRGVLVAEICPTVFDRAAVHLPHRWLQGGKLLECWGSSL